MIPTAHRKPRFSSLVIPLLAVWLGAVAWGVHALLAFSYTPGSSGGLLVTTHEASLAGGPLLLMFVHPQCSCSRASIEELATIMAKADGRLTGRVHVYRPSESEPGWEQTDIWRRAAAIPGVTVTADIDGRMAARNGARVSGETRLFDATGALTFSGGITAARGHQGDNDGRRAILAALTGVAHESRATPVFGCYIHPSAPEQESAP